MLAGTPIELQNIPMQRRGALDLPMLDKPPDHVLEWSRELHERTGLRLGFAYTTIFQQASGGPGRRTGASGDLDIMGAWTLLGRDTPNTGQLFFSFEERYKLGPMLVSGLRNEIGSVHPPANGFDDRGLLVRDVYWIQRLLDGKLGVTLGRANTRLLFGRHGMQHPYASFSNRMFSSNTVIPYPGHGLFADLSIQPIENLYVAAGTTNAYGLTTINDMKFIKERDFFTFAEIGCTPAIEGLGPGRYRVALWNMDSRDRHSQRGDRGFSISADQDLGEAI